MGEFLLKLELYDNIISNDTLYSQINNTINQIGLSDSLLISITRDSFSFNWNDKAKQSLDIRKRLGVYTLIPRKGKSDLAYLTYDEEGIKNAFSILFPDVDFHIAEVEEQPSLEKIVDTEINEIVEEQLPLSIDYKKDFLDFARSIKLDSASEEERQTLFSMYDDLTDEDLEDSNVLDFYNKMSSLYENTIEEDLTIKQYKRFIYATEQVKQSYEEISALREVIDRMKALPNKKLFEFFSKSKRLVYIYDFLKIRVSSNNKRDRLVFQMGSKLGKNKNDIYLYEYITTHEFDHLKRVNPTIDQFSLLFEPPTLDSTQEQIATNYKSPYNPIICTGCAGSGKTLISIEMYTGIVNDYYQKNPIGEHDLIYLTFNENTLNSVTPYIIEKAKVSKTATILNFFKRIIGKRELENFNIVGEKDFTQWWVNKTWASVIGDHKKRKKYWNFCESVDVHFAYTFYRGFFKGSLFYMENDIQARHLSREQFLGLLRNKNEPISEEKANLLFDLFSEYESYLKVEHKVDDNDLARMVILTMNKNETLKYECIIVDEVQDLTEVQLEAIIKSSKNKGRLYFFGDQNQSINPTLFEVSTIKRCLLNNQVQVTKEEYKLTKSYRFGIDLANYINRLTLLINKKIAASGEPLETSALNSERTKWGGKSFDKDVTQEVLLNAINNAKAIIIVPDVSVEKELINLYGEQIRGRVRTIFDAKGLEWDYVVLYKMISYNQHMFEEILNNKAYNSTLHRMIFNQFYVGCTRALVSFTVLEPELTEQLNKELLMSLPEIDIKTVNIYISENNSDEAWEAEGLRLFDLGEYGLALNSFKRIGKIDYNNHIEICNLLIDEEYNQFTAELCRERGFYKEAKYVFSEIDSVYLAKLMGVHCGEKIMDEEWVELIKNVSFRDEDLELLNASGFSARKINAVTNKMNKILHILKGV